MREAKKTLPILMADDDEEDCMLTEDALRESRLKNPIYFVHDGVELMEYLHQEGAYQKAAMPGLILLDLNMPRKDGREALKEIKADPRLRKIPVVILTTSKSESDVLRTYDLGANSYITKPISFQALVEVMLILQRYWFEIVELPDPE